MLIEKVGVLGAGQMGSGIAQVAAQVGCYVTMVDLNGEVLNSALRRMDESCDRLIKKSQMTVDEKGALLSRIKTATTLSELKDCDLVIEAVSENISLKTQLFKQLDELLKPSALIASNTSSISITYLANQTRRASQVAGMHFMNPVALMKLVEGIRGLQTSPTTFEAIKGLAQKMGKTFIESRDMPGFIVNRILMPMINEAFYALYEGIATASDIDEAMKLGTNQPMGPLTLADFIGLDTCLAIMQVLHQGLGDSKYRPCPLLTKYVEAGWLGRKTGRGVYEYPAR